MFAPVDQTAMKLARRVLYILLGCIVFLNVVLAFHAYRFTYFYDNSQRLKTRKAEEYSTGEKIEGALRGMKILKSVVDQVPTVPYDTVQLRTDDGLTLEAWYLPAANARGTVILSHGHASNKSRILPEIQHFHALGFNALAYDFRAHGNSAGNVCTIGYHEVLDLKAAYDHVAQKDALPIVLWGVSMGAATTLKALADYPELKPARVILECPFGSLQEAVEGRVRTMHLPVHPTSTLLMVWGSVERSMNSFAYRPADYARSLRVPVLLNWGALDQRVLRSETDAIFANLGTQDKRLVVYQQSKHESYCQKEPARWKAAVEAFLEPIPQRLSEEPVAVAKN